MNNHPSIGRRLLLAGLVLAAAVVAPARAQTRLASGFDHACALTASGEARCWGSNGSGQIGIGAKDSSWATPARVAGGESFVSIASGLQRTCGLASSGNAYCWGMNRWGALGDGTTQAHLEPAPVSGSLAFKNLSSGSQHACGLTTAGEAWCWGYNRTGQLGDGTTMNRPEPVRVPGGLTFSEIAAGFDHTCALTLRGEAYCWGSNESGQVGDGQPRGERTVPTRVTGNVRFAHIYAGQAQSCGLTAAGAAHCWGSVGQARGLEGAGTTRLEPTLVEAPVSFASLSIGGTHKCGLTKEGRAFCWGLNSFGQLGDGTTDDRLKPTAVKTDQTFTSISAGAFHTCAVTTAGEALCWGRDLTAVFSSAAPRVVEPAPVPGGVTFGAAPGRGRAEN